MSEILTAWNARALRDFCEAGHPAGVAELISVLSGDDTRALTGQVKISILMPGALPKNTVHLHHPGWGRCHNPAVRRVAP